MTTGAGGELHSALLRWIVSRASGVYSEHARVGRIASTLSRDTTKKQLHNNSSLSPILTREDFIQGDAQGGKVPSVLFLPQQSLP